VRFVNRAVLVLRARQPYVDWANGLGEGDERVELDEARTAGSAFLVSPLELEEDARRFVEQHARAMFEHELAMWMDDPATWPERRDVETFHEWFDVEIHDIVVDLGKDPILADELP
jgi:hypothetical protein